MNLFTVGLSGAVLLAASSASFAQPAAQLTPDEIVKALSCPAGTVADANGACQAPPGSSPAAAFTPDPSVQYCAVPPAVPRPLIRTPDGDCVEAKEGTLGFDLGAAANRAAPPTNPAPAARPQNSIASLGRPSATPAPGATLPPTLDLLLTFDTDSANLTDQGEANAKVFAQALERPELKQARFEIEGHTDASGSREYNLTLSEKRAEAVKAFLVSQGVESGRLTTVGYASDHLALPDQPLSRANRRVVARRMQ